MFACSRKNVRRKLNAMTLEFQDKNVLLVDGKLSNYAQGWGVFTNESKQ